MRRCRAQCRITEGEAQGYLGESAAAYAALLKKPRSHLQAGTDRWNPNCPLDQPLLNVARVGKAGWRMREQYF